MHFIPPNHYCINMQNYPSFSTLFQNITEQSHICNHGVREPFPFKRKKNEFIQEIKHIYNTSKEINTLTNNM